MKNFIIPDANLKDPESLNEYLDKSIQAFSDITGIPVTYFGNDNSIIREYKGDAKICNIFFIYKEMHGQCRKNLSSAGQFASRLGEPYIFTCKAGLTNIAVSLIVSEEFRGYFVIGPMVMGEMRGSTQKNFVTLNDLNEEQASIARMFSNTVPSYLPTQISQIALLFYNCVITSVSGDNDYSALRTRNGDQNIINTTIQRYKKEHVEVEYPYDMEQLLIDYTLGGKVQEAARTTEKLLQTFSILEVGELEGIKAKCLWLFAIIIRIASENGSKLEETVDMDIDIINRISEAEDFQKLKDTSIALIQMISQNMLTSVYSGHSQIVSHAIQYIQKHFREKITLNDIGNILHVNSSYFSTLFRREIGMTFTDYINSLRIAHACNLLVNSNMSIVDISTASGFEDQSYFTKVFKKANGVTPKVYRYNNMKK